MTSPLRSHRARCALHGLATAHDGLCVRCRRDAGDSQGHGLGWPAVLAFGCCAAGLIGWQVAKMGPDAVSLRPQHHLAVVSMQATVPVQQLRQEQLEGSRARRPMRPSPVPAAYAPGAVEVTITAAEKAALEAPAPEPVPYYGYYDAGSSSGAPAKVVVKLVPKGEGRIPVFHGEGPLYAPVGGGGRHRPAVGRPPVLLPPPGGSFPGGGTGELWKPRAPSEPGSSAPRRAPSRRRVKASSSRPAPVGGARAPSATRRSAGSGATASAGRGRR